MGVPWLLSLALTYTAGAMVLMPFQLAFAIYDVAVFIKRGAKYTSKGVYYLQRFRANRRALATRKHVAKHPVVPGDDWVIFTDSNAGPSDTCSEGVANIPAARPVAQPIPVADAVILH